MKTSRLELVPLAGNDLELFREINTNPHVRKFLWDDQVMPDAVFGQILDGVQKHFVNDQWGLWKIKLSDTGSAIGYAGLWTFFDEPRPQLLCALLPEHTGKGYASEAAKLVMDHAFRVLKYPNLVASMDRNNLASRRVCERLGFRLEGEKMVDGKPIVFYKLERP